MMLAGRRLLLLALLASTLPTASSARLTRGDGRADGGGAPTEASLLYEPTPPVALAKVFTESAPVTTLVVALPEEVVLGDARKADFFSRLIEAAVGYVKVVVLVNEDERLAIQKITELIRRHVQSPDAVLSRVTFVRAAFDTEWVRDYGPLFGAGPDGEPVLLDNMARDIRREAQTARAPVDLGYVRTPGRETYLSDYGHFWRRDDDAAPMYFNEILYRERFRFAPLVRPPLQLAGGDLVFTENARLLTSTQTLEINGGDERRFRRLAKDYFNVDDVLYLRPLPNSIWHVDMFFKFAGPRVALIGTFETPHATQSKYLEALQQEAAGILAWNRHLLEAHFPGLEVIGVPMPPITQTAVASTGTVIYRSFLNSVVLNGAEGRSAVLVPSFSGLERMEGTVEAAYRRAFPGADIHFLNADALAEDFGGIHCVTVTIPSFDPARKTPADPGRR